MSLFNETLDSITYAIVTIKRALKTGVIEKENYKELDDYLGKRAVELKVKKSHITKAKRDLDDELESEEEFFMDKDDALYKMAEEILEDFTFRKDGQEQVEDKQASVCAAWMKMDDEERVAMAAMASAWQMGRTLDSIKGAIKASGK